MGEACHGRGDTAVLGAQDFFPDRQSSSVIRLGLTEPPLLLGDQGERMKRPRRFDPFQAGLLPDAQAASIQGCRLVGAAADFIKLGMSEQQRRDLGMLGPDRFLGDGDGPAVLGLGIRFAIGDDKELGAMAENAGGLNMVRPNGRLDGGQGTPVEGLGLVEAPQGSVDLGERIQGPGRFQMTDAKFPLGEPDRLFRGARRHVEVADGEVLRGLALDGAEFGRLGSGRDRPCRDPCDKKPYPQRHKEFACDSRGRPMVP